jgi:predicted RNase H-like HicB family nuclease
VTKASGDTPSRTLGNDIIACRQRIFSRISAMTSTFAAIMKKEGDWWIGWIEEVPGVNAQENTKEKLISSLKEILSEALEFNRSEARQAAN